ncbi:hypothetical protein VIGAN_03119600 [Vigna angularis var. angularis]|uniref:Uncharacterized protein n=1 Tax=Vigna angularis var. angularis TaxID=157739 RepID=A0A0S3RLP2_PHAAN|nr:hypothetical protein VIGAN_03119600 [Vigna angularis var. angularis]
MHGGARVKNGGCAKGGWVSNRPKAFSFSSLETLRGSLTLCIIQLHSNETPRSLSQETQRCSSTLQQPRPSHRPNSHRGRALYPVQLSVVDATQVAASHWPQIRLLSLSLRGQQPKGGSSSAAHAPTLLQIDIANLRPWRRQPPPSPFENGDPKEGFPPPSSLIPSSPTTPIIIIILNHRTLLFAFNIHPLPGNSASDNREPHQTYKKQPKPFPNYHRLLRALRIFPKPPNHRLLPLRVFVIYFVFVWLGMRCGDSRECEYGYGDGGNEGGGDESVKMKPLFVVDSATPTVVADSMSKDFVTPAIVDDSTTPGLAPPTNIVALAPATG